MRQRKMNIVQGKGYAQKQNPRNPKIRVIRVPDKK